MRRRQLGLGLGALLLGTACARADAQPLPVAPAPSPTPAPPIQLPRDAGSHDTLTEWWYYTGHLRTPDQANQYGFEFVIFQVRREGIPTGYLAHFAVSDITRGVFSHQARVSSGPPQDRPLFEVNGWTLRLLEDGTETIEAQMLPGPGAEPAYGLWLRLEDRKPPVLHNGGYIDYGAAGGSYYYSRTRIDARGDVLDQEGRRLPVQGQAWMDHQWGNFVVASAGGWDWFSLQMEDNTEWMLYALRGANGETSTVYGSRVLADGRVVALPNGAVRLAVTERWTSPHTGGVYPSGWIVDVPGQQVRLRVTPKLKDQELWFPGAQMASTTYWEGAVSVEGEQAGVAVRGEGYVELTGYV